MTGYDVSPPRSHVSLPFIPRRPPSDRRHRAGPEHRLHRWQIRLAGRLHRRAGHARRHRAPEQLQLLPRHREVLGRELHEELGRPHRLRPLRPDQDDDARRQPRRALGSTVQGRCCVHPEDQRLPGGHRFPSERSRGDAASQDRREAEQADDTSTDDAFSRSRAPKRDCSSPPRQAPRRSRSSSNPRRVARRRSSGRNLPISP